MPDPDVTLNTKRGGEAPPTLSPIPYVFPDLSEPLSQERLAELARDASAAAFNDATSQSVTRPYAPHYPDAPTAVYTPEPLPSPEQVYAALRTCYAQLQGCLQQEYTLRQSANRYAAAAKSARQTLILRYAENPTTIGKNEAAREAFLSSATHAESLQADVSALNVEAAAQATEIARLHLAQWRAVLRILEIKAGMNLRPEE